ncbi:spermatogenesis-associated protein 20-like isoform X2 [Olea europaea var. sylvestris]|uniref:spermatogenesis-associated protein 20-like isoform X2 n=1 Tax=Olea europaea var. sylvestris TaxID=158386 RepID=UPI000C1D5B17|nr:spermatogenesis-associated protein 20-like isoform X2 [Olea europaea var. sylvestris]
MILAIGFYALTRFHLFEVGYSTCHWCHVMEVESFENEEVAKLLNDWFVSIKVDREERPDVDKVYMTYVQALYGGGGWPLSVFLSPDLKPLMGGTYFPPDDKYGRPGFKTILWKVKEAWESKRDVLVQSGSFAIEQLSEALSTAARLDKLPDGVPQMALKLCAEQLADSYDSKYGGFGSAPKFPRPVEAQLMLYHSKKLEETGRSEGAKEDLSMVITTLECMARGGIHDHVGGGFHRYSVDECWHVPHFEKMLYDQGQLANVYLDVFSITKDVFYSTMARDILDYLRRDMIGPNGEIFSAEDADSAESEDVTRKKEGAFYVWTSHESEEYREVAEKAASFIRKNLYNQQTCRLQHSFRNGPSKAPGFLDDYAFLISGLLDLYEVGGSVFWLAWAIELQRMQDELFLDKEGGGYFNTPGEDPSVLLRVKEDHDGAEPSGNSVSVINLVRLASLVSSTKSDNYRQNAERLLAVFEKRLKDTAMAVPLMCCAADMLAVPSHKQVVLVGCKPSVEFDSMLAAAHASYNPNRTVIHINPNDDEERAFWEETNENIALMAKNNFAAGKVVALVCQNFTCSPVVDNPRSLESLLSK